jgi:hypothetical protein
MDIFVSPLMQSALLMLAGALVVGFVVGILSGMLGIGGGTILVPTFKVIFDMVPLMCTATSLFTIIPTSISGAITHLRHKTCLPRLGIAAGLGGACLSPVGVWLAALSPDWCVMGAAALVIGYSALTMFRKALAAPRGLGKKIPSAEERAAEIQQAHAQVPPLGVRELAKGFAIGLGAGLASGYVGVGGGFLMVPLMMSFLNVPMKLTSGTSLIAVMILAIPGVITQALLGNINWIAGIAVACGSIPGALVGARLIPYIPERLLRFIFSGFLVVAALLLIFK